MTATPMNTEIDLTKPMSVEEWTAIQTKLTDPKTKKFSSGLIAAQSPLLLEKILTYLISLKRPVIAYFVTPQNEQTLRDAGYIPGYHNQFYPYWIRPEQAEYFTADVPPEPPQPPASTPAVPAIPAVVPESKVGPYEKKREPREDALSGSPQTFGMEAIAAQLRQLRLQKGLTLDQLAALSGVSKTQLSRIESSRHGLNINAADTILRALGYQITGFSLQAQSSTH